MRARLIGFLLAAIVTAFVGARVARAQDLNELIERSITWTHKGKEFQVECAFASTDYSRLKALPRFRDVLSWDLYVTQDIAQGEIADLAGRLDELASTEGMGKWEKLHFVIAFAQSLEYISDDGEYPKYPVETLVDLGGDCEDTSILLASLLLKLDYDVMLVLLPGHMAIAVEWSEWVPLEAGRSKTTIEGRSYYLIETTWESPVVGESELSPDEIEGMIRPLQRSSLSLSLVSPIHWQQKREQGVGFMVRAEIVNMGSAASAGATVKAEVLRSATVIVDASQMEIEALEGLASQIVTFYLTAPLGSPFFLRISLSVEEGTLDEFTLRLRSP